MKRRLVIHLLLTLLALSLCFSFASCKENSVGDADFGSPENSSEIVNSELNRKIIYKVDIDIESENISELKSNIASKCESLGGYVENNNESYSDGECSFVRTTYRIPTEKLDDFISSVESYGGIERKNVSTTDITTAYVNAEAKRSSLEERKSALEKILEDTEISASDKVNIINEISSVNAELQSIELTIKSYDSRVDYSYVHITIDEPTDVSGVIFGLIIFLGIPSLIVGIIILIYDLSRKKKVNKSKNV